MHRPSAPSRHAVPFATASQSDAATAHDTRCNSPAPIRPPTPPHDTRSDRPPHRSPTPPRRVPPDRSRWPRADSAVDDTVHTPRHSSRPRNPFHDTRYNPRAAPPRRTVRAPRAPPIRPRADTPHGSACTQHHSRRLANQIHDTSSRRPLYHVAAPARRVVPQSPSPPHADNRGDTSDNSAHSRLPDPRRDRSHMPRSRRRPALPHRVRPPSPSPRAHARLDNSRGTPDTRAPQSIHPPSARPRLAASRHDTTGSRVPDPAHRPAAPRAHGHPLSNRFLHVATNSDDTACNSRLSSHPAGRSYGTRDTPRSPRCAPAPHAPGVTTGRAVPDAATDHDIVDTRHRTIRR